MLIRSEPRLAGVVTLYFEKAPNAIIIKLGIPASEILVATAEQKGWSRLIPFSDRELPIQFVR